MMIKLWRYLPEGGSGPHGVLGQSSASAIALAKGCYIANLEVPCDDAGALKLVRPVGDYVTGLDKSPERVAGIYACNLRSKDPQAQIEELAVGAGAAGLDRFWHLVVSHRPGEKLDDEQREVIRRTVSRILGVEDCQMIWVTHADTDHDHDHALIVTRLADSGESVKLGDGWWKEKSQIAIAICEHQLGLEPEPNRRYVADERGVFHLFSHTKVADANGELLLDGKEMRAMQRAHDAIVRENEAGQGHHPGDRWPLQRAAKMLAKPRIQKAQSWQQVHEDLASIGFRYVKVGNTGVLEAVTNAGDWEECEGIRCAAGDAYSNAALGKLSKRLRQDYVPPAPGLRVRSFVMPCFNASKEVTKDNPSNRKEELAEYKALIEHLRTDYSKTYKVLRDTEKGARVNEARAARRSAHQNEIEAVKSTRRHVVAPSRSAATSGAPSPVLVENQVAAFAWGPARNGAQAEKEREEREAKLERLYKVERTANATHYFLDGQLAFIEHRRTIQLVLARRKARIHAMELARAKFKHIRIVARQRLRENLAWIAAELGLTVGPEPLADIAENHRQQVAADRGKSIIEKARAFAQTEALRRRRRREVQQDRERRAWDTSSLTSARLNDYRERNEEDSDVGCFPYPPKHIAHKASQKLNFLDRNILQLVASRYDLEGVRFLDDRALTDAFAAEPRFLILPNVQKRLQAIEAIQIEERRWIAAAVLNGRVTFEDGHLKASNETDRWAEDFWAKQKDDPSFHRLLLVARIRPDRFQFDLDERPDIRAWKAALGREDQDRSMIAEPDADGPSLSTAIADEIFQASEYAGWLYGQRHLKAGVPLKRHPSAVAKDNRDRILKALPYKESEALRRTGRFRDEHRQTIYRDPEETDRSWQQRQRNLEKIFGPRSGYFR